MAAVGAISYMGGNTNTSGGLRTVRQQQFIPSRGDRTGVENILFIITDGESNIDQHLTIFEAEQAKSVGMRIFGIGITNAINRDELRLISSPPQLEGRNWWITASYQTLSAIADTLLRETCAPRPGEAGNNI